MKRLWIILFLFLSGNTGRAQWIKVLDETESPIGQVAIQFASSERTYVTNPNGLVKLSMTPQQGEKINFKHIAYEALTLAFKPADTLIAVLSPRLIDLEGLTVKPMNEKALFKKAINMLKAGIDDKKVLRFQASYGRFRMKGFIDDLKEPQYLNFGDGVFLIALPFDRENPGGKYWARFGANGYQEHHTALWINRTMEEDYDHIGKLYERVFARQLELWNDGRFALFKSKPMEAIDSFVRDGEYLFRYQVDRNEVRAFLDVEADSGYPRRMEIFLKERPIELNNFFDDRQWLTGEMRLIIEYTVGQFNGKNMAVVSSIRTKDVRVMLNNYEFISEVSLDWDFQAYSVFSTYTESHKPKRIEYFFLSLGSQYPNFDESSWKSSGKWDDFLAFADILLDPSEVALFNWDYPNNPRELITIMKMTEGQRIERENRRKQDYLLTQKWMESISR